MVYRDSDLKSWIRPQEEHKEEEGSAAEHEQEQQPSAAALGLGELRALWRRGILLGVGRHLGRRLPRRRLQEPDGGRQAAGSTLEHSRCVKALK